MLSAKDLVSHVVLPSTVTDLVNRIATGRLSTKSDYVSYCVQAQNSQPERENISPEKHPKRRHSTHKEGRSKNRDTNYGPFKYSSKSSRHKHSSKLTSNAKYLSYSGFHSNVVKCEVQCPDCGIQFHSEVKLPSNILHSNQEKSSNHANHQHVEAPKHIKIAPITINTSSYECKICNRMFSNKDTYNKHLNYHMQGQKYKCSQCTLSFSTKIALIDHYVVHKVFICKICNKHFPDNWKLTRHMKTHWKYKCNQCKKSFPDKKALDTHALTHKKKECSIVLKQTDISKEAIAAITGEGFENGIAEKSNVSKQIVTYTTEAMYASDISPEKFNLLNKIVTQNTGDTIAVSQEKSEINTPAITHTAGAACESDISPEKFSVVKYIDSPPPAETCGNMALDKSNPLNFMIVNTSSETSKADISEEKSNIANQVVELASSGTMDSNGSFQTSSLMQNLKNLIEKQQQMSSQKLQFSDSYKGHFQDGRHQCTECSKSFKDKGKLKRHMVIHTEERSHMCNFCGKKFHYKWRLTQHFKIHTKKSCVSITDVTQEENEAEMT